MSEHHSESIWKACIFWKPPFGSILAHLPFISGKLDLKKPFFETDSKPSPSGKILKVTIGSCQGVGQKQIVSPYLCVKSRFSGIFRFFVFTCKNLNSLIGYPIGNGAGGTDGPVLGEPGWSLLVNASLRILSEPFR